MNRIAQGLTLVLLGVAALTATVPTDMYLNWVKSGFGPFLIASGLVMVLLGVLVIIAELRDESHALDEEEVTPESATHASEGPSPAADAHATDGHEEHGGHEHSRAPRVAWLLLLPVVAVFVIAPPALGSYTVESTGGSSAPPEDNRGSDAFNDALADAGPEETVPLAIQEFVMRAWIDEDRELADREVELTGFAVPNEEGEGWFLARLQMACCAADAVVNKVLVTDRPEPEVDSWWTVRGTWVEPEGELGDVEHHEFEAADMEEVDNPPDPYE